VQFHFGTRHEQRMDKTMRPRAKPISLKVPGGALLLAGMPDGVHCF
jgi:hypothetical protein